MFINDHELGLRNAFSLLISLQWNLSQVLNQYDSLLQVKSIAECILQYFWLALSDQLSWKPILIFFWVVA